jgi:hypothetical protein
MTISRKSASLVERARVRVCVCVCVCVCVWVSEWERERDPTKHAQGTHRLIPFSSLILSVLHIVSEVQTSFWWQEASAESDIQSHLAGGSVEGHPCTGWGTWNSCFSMRLLIEVKPECRKASFLLSGRAWYSFYLPISYLKTEGFNIQNCSFTCYFACVTLGLSPWRKNIDWGYMKTLLSRILA